MDLAQCREKLDEIDAQIVDLYAKRMDIAKDVAKDKIATGKKIFDAQREQNKINAVREMVEEDYYKKGVEELFSLLMASSRKLQYKILSDMGINGRVPFIAVDDLDKSNARVVFQGTQGSYSQAALKAYFGDSVKSFSVDTFRDAMISIAEGSADYGVLPIENSSAGIVSENYDLLVEFENFIVAEQIIKIDNCLLGLPGAKEEDIKVVYSHPQALMQSARYLDQHRDMKQVQVLNTAIAAKKVLEDGDISQGAIAGAHAAPIYGLDIIKEATNHNKTNSTRFIIVTNQKIFKQDAKKVSICFELPHRSGSLYRILSHFIYNDLNMNRIESRPIEERPWEYRFFVDFDGNLADSAVKNAIRGIMDESKNLRILGNY